MDRVKILLSILGISLLYVLGNLPKTHALQVKERQAIPDKLVVLTFDDACKSDVEYVAPLLKRYSFGATFFITEAYKHHEGWKERNYLTWEDVKKIYDTGFEIGNHTRTHPNVGQLSKDKIRSEIEYIEQRCKEYGIAVPKTFCYPGFQYSRDAVEVLQEKGYLFARRGVAPEFPYNREGARGPVYDPSLDHPLLLPTTGFSGPDWDYDDFLWAVDQARDGKIAVLTFHGVPDVDHPWVHTDPKVFTTYMDYLRDNGYTVIAMRDLVKYVDPSPKLHGDPFAPIQQRLKERQLKLKELRCEYAVNPLGIDVKKPRFSWLLESSQRGQMQSAYRILVASSTQKLKPGTADKWDSEKVVSDKSVNIVYEGKPLSSAEKCYWKVRVRDKNGKASLWSKPATFEMGLLKESDWQGDWIAMDGVVQLDYVTGKFGPAINLKGENQTVRIPHYARLKPENQITISAWIKPGEKFGPQSSKGWVVIYRKEDGDARHVLALGSSGNIKGAWLGLGIAGNYVELGADAPLADLEDGQWHLVVGTYDGSFMKLYIDGLEIASRAQTGNIDTFGSSSAYIGSNSGTHECFSGGIDDLRIYHRALSKDQIKTMANGVSVESNLVGCWKLDGNLKNSVSGADGTGQRGGASPSAPLLRKEFELSKKVKRARIYICGLGWYELYLNGRKVGDLVLDPIMTDYDLRTLYVTYDVTNMLEAGVNVAGVTLGNGWFSEPPRYGDFPRVLVQMNIEFVDGSVTSIKSDETWKTSHGPIIRNSIQGGETYDARLEKSGWTKSGYDDATWSAAIRVDGPGGKMESQMLPAMKVMQNLKPVKLTNPQPGVYVYDLGQFFGGWARLKMKGPRGAQVTIKYSGRIFEDSGLVDKRPYPTPLETDYYILKGDPVGEVYEPTFTFHPVRYVQIEGYPGVPTVHDLEGRVVYNSVDMSGDFECSNDLLNQVHRNAVWTLTNELYGFPLDCLHREPYGALDPATVTGTLYPRKYMPRFWTKWLADSRYLQQENGIIVCRVPNYVGSRTLFQPAYSGNYPLLVWYLYQYYGDMRILEENYACMKRWLDYMISRADHNILSTGTSGDHMLPGDAPGKEEFMSNETPFPLLWNGYYYRSASIISQVAKLLGKNNDAEIYGRLAGKIKDALNKKWFNTDTYNYATGSQTSNLFALALGIVPEENKTGVVRNIVENIMKQYNGHLHTGNIGTNALIEALTEHGGGEAMYSAATRTAYPGWGYMVEQGATTIWEAWGRYWHSSNRKRADSMIMWANIEEFFYNDLAGIKGPDYYGPGYMSPGFRHIQIKPSILGDLTYAGASIKTVRGMVSSHWKKQDDSLILEVTIPVNSEAKVSVPKLGLKQVEVYESGKTVWQNNRFIAGVTGINAGTEIDDYVTFAVGSGSYRFELKGRN